MPLDVLEEPGAVKGLPSGCDWDCDRAAEEKAGRGMFTATDVTTRGSAEKVVRGAEAELLGLVTPKMLLACDCDCDWDWDWEPLLEACKACRPWSTNEGGPGSIGPPLPPKPDPVSAILSVRMGWVWRLLLLVCCCCPR